MQATAVPATLVYGRRGTRAATGHAWDQGEDGRLLPLCQDQKLVMVRGKGFAAHDRLAPPGVAGCLACKLELVRRGVDPEAPLKPAAAPAPPARTAEVAASYEGAGVCGTCRLPAVRRHPDGALLHKQPDRVPSAKGRGGCKEVRLVVNQDAADASDQEDDAALLELDRVINANSATTPVDRIYYHPRLEPAIRRKTANTNGVLLRYRGIDLVQDQHCTGVRVRKRVPHAVHGAKEAHEQEAVSSRLRVDDPPPAIRLPPSPPPTQAPPAPRPVPAPEPAAHALSGRLYVVNVAYLAQDDHAAEVQAHAAAKAVGGIVIEHGKAKVEVQHR